MREGGEYSTERLFSLFEAHLTHAIEITAKGVNLHIDHQWEVTPELVMNLLMHNTVECGEDISHCAELYTVGVDGAGLAVVADSFGALSERIEREKRLIWEEMYTALDDNFANERTRLMLASTPKYCGGNTAADKWAKRITESWLSIDSFTAYNKRKRIFSKKVPSFCLQREEGSFLMCRRGNGRKCNGQHSKNDHYFDRSFNLFAFFAHEYCILSYSLL